MSKYPPEFQKYIDSKIPPAQQAVMGRDIGIMFGAWSEGRRIMSQRIGVPLNAEAPANCGVFKDASPARSAATLPAYEPRMTKADLIAFEDSVKGLWETGELPYLVHLCGGNEDQLIEIFREVGPQDWVFSSHRSHYHYLLHGGDRDRLLDLIKRGSSMFVFDQERQFVTSSVLAGTCCIAAGVAWELASEMSGADRRPHVWCFLGDGAEDEGHFYEAVRFVQGHNLPCTFVIEDNDRSVDTTKAARKSVPIPWPDCVRRYHYTPTYPHAGSGCKHHIKFNPNVRPS